MSDSPNTYPNEGCSDLPEAAVPRFTPVSFEAFTDAPPMEWIIKRVLPKAELAVVFGESGSGKSFLALDMIMNIARGLDWQGHKTKTGRVVYICAEGVSGLRSRLKAFKLRHLIDDPASLANFSIIPDAPNFLSDADPNAVIKTIGKASVIVIDTFARITAGGNENDGQDMGAAIARCQALHMATGALIVLIHHSGKDASRGSRGWSGIKAAADTEIEVLKINGSHKATITKQKDGPDGASWGFNLISMDIGVDEDNEPITSCYYEEADTPQRLERERPLGKWEQKVSDAFDYYGLPQIAVDQVIGRVVDQTPRDENKVDKRRDYAFRAVDTLVGKKIFCIKDKQIYRA